MSVITRDNEYHTYADYLDWSRTSGDELIEGVAYVRQPGPTLSHQLIVGELYYQVRRALKGTSWRAFVAPFDVRLPKSNERDEDVDTVVQPDVFLTRDLSKVDERGVRGAPDWIVEVLSPGTARHDQRKKIPVYERAGVPEVWLVSPRSRTATIYRLLNSVYGEPTTQKLVGRTALAVAPEVVIDWEPVEADIF
jgi:Uma2 family endonuclease